MNFIKKIDNAYLAFINWATSTKGAMYILTAAIWISVALNPPTSIYAWLIVIVSVYYQGVALPGLGYQTKFENSETRQLMLDIHNENQEELADQRQMHEETQQMVAEIREMHQELSEILKQLQQK